MKQLAIQRDMSYVPSQVQHLSISEHKLYLQTSPASNKMIATQFSQQSSLVWPMERIIQEQQSQPMLPRKNIYIPSKNWSIKLKNVLVEIPAIRSYTQSLLFYHCLSPIFNLSMGSGLDFGHDHETPVL